MLSEFKENPHIERLGRVGEQLRKWPKGFFEYGTDIVRRAISQSVADELPFEVPAMDNKARREALADLTKDAIKVGRVRTALGRDFFTRLPSAAECSEHFFEETLERFVDAFSQADLETAYSQEERRSLMLKYFEHLQGITSWIAAGETRRQTRPLSPIDVSMAQWANQAPSAPIHFTYDLSNPDELSAYQQQKAQLEKNEIDHDVDEVEGKVHLIIRGSRAMTAFYKTQCPFKCTYCVLPGKNDEVALYEERFGKIHWTQQLTAFVHALLTRLRDQPVVEILNDGSWFSDNEIPPRLREAIMNLLAQIQSVHCVAVETRPDFSRGKKGLRNIEADLDRLRDNQKLVIYIGLESTDDMTAFITRKHYGFGEFVAAVEGLAELLERRPELRHRVSIRAYNIMKQWYMTDREAVEETVKMGQKLAELAKQTGIEIEMKTEPTIVSKGTAQDYGHHCIQEDGSRLYKNLNYFSVAEAVARLGAIGMADTIAFGQRDDIDEIETLAIIPDPEDEMLQSRLDFIVYNSVQQFQVHRSLRLFARSIEEAVYGPDGELTPEFLAWQNEVYPGESSSLLELIEPFRGKALRPEEEKETHLNRRVVNVMEHVKQDPECRRLATLKKTKALGKRAQAFFERAAQSGDFSVDHVENTIWVDPNARDFGHVEMRPEAPVGCRVEVVLLRPDKTPMNVWLFVEASDNVTVNAA